MASIIPEQNDTPATHALVIGVSRYLHLHDGEAPTPIGQEIDISQLSAAARSASLFANWLMKEHHFPDKPLGSLRVLLSPSEGEIIDSEIEALLPKDENGELAAETKATRENVENQLKEFLALCRNKPDDRVIVYVAGHGVQLSKHGAIVLLEDYASDEHLSRLGGAIDVERVHAGMDAPGFPSEQFWFVDACRQKPEIAKRFESISGALKLDVLSAAGHASPLVLAAVTGTAAYAYPNEETLFYRALSWAIEGGAGTGPRNDEPNWHVPVSKLFENLPGKVKALAREKGAEQNVDFAGNMGNIILHHLKGPPQVLLELSLTPQDAEDKSTGKLLLNGAVEVVSGIDEWPFRHSVQAGLYILDIQAQPPFKSAPLPAHAEPPTTSQTLMVEQL